jgi:hypothetical protein
MARSPQSGSIKAAVKLIAALWLCAAESVGSTVNTCLCDCLNPNWFHARMLNVLLCRGSAFAGSVNVCLCNWYR